MPLDNTGLSTASSAFSSVVNGIEVPIIDDNESIDDIVKKLHR